MPKGSVNKVIMIGNIGQDPVERYTASGMSVCNLSLAVSDYKKDSEDKSETSWHRLLFVGKLSEVVYKYLKKGNKIYIEGKLVNKKWTDKLGIERMTTEIFVFSLEMLGGAKKSDGGEPQIITNGLSEIDIESGDLPSQELSDEIPF